MIYWSRYVPRVARRRTFLKVLRARLVAADENTVAVVSTKRPAPGEGIRVLIRSGDVTVFAETSARCVELLKHVDRAISWFVFAPMADDARRQAQKRGLTTGNASIWVLAHDKLKEIEDGITGSMLVSRPKASKAAQCGATRYAYVTAIVVADREAGQVQTWAALNHDVEVLVQAQRL